MEGTASDREHQSLHVKLKEAAECERQYTQLRFQTLSLYLAAVGLIVGFGPASKAIGALLLIISIGLWILDLRNRDLLEMFREIGGKVEERINELDGVADVGGIFLDRLRRGPHRWVGLLDWQGPVGGRLAGLVAYQVGIDLTFFGVMGYGVLLIVGRAGFFQFLVLAPLAFTLLIRMSLGALSRTRVDAPLARSVHRQAPP